MSDDNEMEREIREAFGNVPGHIMDSGMQATTDADGNTRLHVALPGGQEGVIALLDEIGKAEFMQVQHVILHALISAYALGYTEGSTGRPHAFEVEETHIIDMHPDSDE